MCQTSLIWFLKLPDTTEGISVQEYALFQVVSRGRFPASELAHHSGSQSWFKGSSVFLMMLLKSKGFHLPPFDMPETIWKPKMCLYFLFLTKLNGTKVCNTKCFCLICSFGCFCLWYFWLGFAELLSSDLTSYIWKCAVSWDGWVTLLSSS